MGIITSDSSAFTCELRILGGKNIEPCSAKNLFVRIYLSALNNKRVKLDTMEISSDSEVFWGKTFSLECLGKPESMEKLKQESVTFELRQKNTVPILGNLGGSRLLGRGKVSLGEAFEFPIMKVGKWVSMEAASRRRVKVPEIEVEIAVRLVPAAAEQMRRRGLKECESECGCRNGRGYCEDYNVFAMAAALEVF